MSMHAIRQKFGSISARKREKGASALEYLVLAAAIIIIIGALGATGGLDTIVQDAFSGLFTEAADTTAS
ncbi:MAG: hypothetical protein RIK85_17630 [Marinobacter sp.]